MATALEIQAELDAGATMKIINIEKQLPNGVSTTSDLFFCTGIGRPYTGHSRWCATTNTDTAANQAAEIIAAMA